MSWRLNNSILIIIVGHFVNPCLSTLPSVRSVGMSSNHWQCVTLCLACQSNAMQLDSQSCELQLTAKLADDTTSLQFRWISPQSTVINCRYFFGFPSCGNSESKEMSLRGLSGITVPRASLILNIIQCSECDIQIFIIFWLSHSLPCGAFQFAIRIDSIRYANRFESIRLVKKNRPLDSLLVMQLFLFIYCIVSAKK